MDDEYIHALKILKLWEDAGGYVNEKALEQYKKYLALKNMPLAIYEDPTLIPWLYRLTHTDEEAKYLMQKKLQTLRTKIDSLDDI